jgi:hypothetical protein
MGLENIPLIVSCLSGIVSILAIVNFIHSRRQEREERRREQEKDALWKQSVNDQLDRLTKRVDSHNRYAEMFREYGEDIAFIRGQLEK